MSKNDKFGKHEVVHTASIIAEMFETYISDHGAVRATPTVKKEAEKVLESLFDFYQLVGSKWVEEK